MPEEFKGVIKEPESPKTAAFIGLLSFWAAVVDDKETTPPALWDCLTSKLRSSTNPTDVVSQYISKTDSTGAVSKTLKANPKVPPLGSILPIFLAVVSLAIYGFDSLL